jgi:hypothetical protein
MQNVTVGRDATGLRGVSMESNVMKEKDGGSAGPKEVIGLAPKGVRYLGCHLGCGGCPYHAISYPELRN